MRAVRAYEDGQTCNVGGCDRLVLSRFLCEAHYWRVVRGKTMEGPIRQYRPKDDRPEAERFWSRVSRGAVDACWLWTGSIDPGGYGRHYLFGFRAGHVKAHRFAYELEVGPIPDGLTIDHLCRNRVCVNPSHMEPVTLAENIRRAWAARKRAAQQTNP